MSGEEHSKKRGTASACSLGQEHAQCVRTTAKGPACAMLSEQEGDGGKFLRPGADIVSSESTLSVELSLGVLISCTRDVVLGLDPKLHCILWERRDIGDQGQWEKSPPCAQMLP